MIKRINLEKEVLKLLECSKCKQHFSDPTFTKCNHIFCKTCIAQVLLSSEKLCPVCKTELSKETNKNYDRIYRICHVAENLRRSAELDKEMEEKISIVEELDKNFEVKESYIKDFLNLHSDVLLDIANIGEAPPVAQESQLNFPLAKPVEDPQIINLTPHLSISQTESPHKRYIDALSTPIKNNDHTDDIRTNENRIQKVKNWLKESQNIFDEISSSEKKFAKESVLHATLNVPSVSQIKYVAPPRHSSSEDDSSVVEFGDDNIEKETEENVAAEFSKPHIATGSMEGNISNIDHVESIEMCVEYSNIKSEPTPVLKHSLQRKEANRIAFSTQQNIKNIDMGALRTQNTQSIVRKDKVHSKKVPTDADRIGADNNNLLVPICRFFKHSSIVENVKIRHTPFYKLGKCSMNTAFYIDKSCQTDIDQILPNQISTPILPVTELQHSLPEEESLNLRNIPLTPILPSTSFQNHMTEERSVSDDRNNVTVIRNPIPSTSICLELANETNNDNDNHSFSSSNSFTPLRDIGKSSSEICKILNKKKETSDISFQSLHGDPTKTFKRIRRVSTSSDSSVTGQPTRKRVRKPIVNKHFTELSVLLTQSPEPILISGDTSSKENKDVIPSEDSEPMNYDDILSTVFANIEADMNNAQNSKATCSLFTCSSNENVQKIMNVANSGPLQHRSSNLKNSDPVACGSKKHSNLVNEANENNTMYTDDMDVEETFVSATSRFDQQRGNSQKTSDVNKENQMKSLNKKNQVESLCETNQTIDRVMLKIGSEVFDEISKQPKDDPNKTIVNNKESKNKLQHKNKEGNIKTQLNYDSDGSVIEQTPPKALSLSRSSAQSRHLRSKISLNFNEGNKRSFKKDKSVEPLENTPKRPSNKSHCHLPNLLEDVTQDAQVRRTTSVIDTPSCISKFVRDVVNRSTPVATSKTKFATSVNDINIPESEYVNSDQTLLNKSLLETSLKKKFICLTTSSLDKTDIAIVDKFVNKFNAKYSTQFQNKTSHIIFKVDSENRASRTVKFVRGLAKGIWLLNMKWILACLEKGTIMDEEPFEVLDMSNEPGPLRCRTMDRSVFLNWLSVAFVESFSNIAKDILQEVVEAFGGKCVEKFDDTIRCQLIILECNNYPDEALHKKWSTQLCAPLVDIAWLLEVVCRGQLISIFTYLLSDTTFNIESNPKCPAELLYQDSQWSEDS